MAIGSIPDANGSNVPPWPTFFIFNIFEILVTANLDEIPTGLSNTIQPLIFSVIINPTNSITSNYYYLFFELCCQFYLHTQMLYQLQNLALEFVAF